MRPAAPSWLALPLLLLGRLAPAWAFGGWLTNDGTASTSLVVADSGTTPSGSPLIARQKPFMAVDGNVSSQWNAEIDTTDNSCWLVLDFGASEATIHGFALIQRGDITHDVKDHELQAGATQGGPWKTVGSFVGEECKPPAFAAAQCRVKNQAGAAAFRQAFDLPSPATSRYFRWVAKTRFSEYQLYLYEIQFRESGWGATLLLVLTVASCAYLVGGVGHAANTEGKPLRLSSHPHLALWAEVHGLVVDGVEFSRGRRGRGGYMYARVDEGGRADKRDEGAKEKGSARAKAGGGGKQKKSRTSKERRREGADGHGASPGSGTSKGAPAVEGRGDAPTPAPPPAPVEGTAAGGGGRWVHVPS